MIKLFILATPNNFYGNPEELIGESVIISGYNPPAVAGTTVTFHCPHGLVLEGIKSATYMENGEWDPDPYKLIHCLGSGMFSIMVVVHADNSVMQTLKLCKHNY